MYPLQENIKKSNGVKLTNLNLENISFNIEVLSQSKLTGIGNNESELESISIPYTGFMLDSLAVKNLEKGMREHRYLREVKKRPFYDPLKTHIEITSNRIITEPTLKGQIHAALAIFTVGVVPFYLKPMFRIQYQVYKDGILVKTYTYQQGYEFYFGSISAFFFWVSDWDKMDMEVIYPTVNQFFEEAVNDGYIR